MPSFGSSSYASIGSSREVRLFRSWEDVYPIVDTGLKMFDVSSPKGLHQIVETGLEMFDVSSPKELQDYLTYLTHEMGSEGTLYFIFRKHPDTRSASVFVFGYSLCY